MFGKVGRAETATDPAPMEMIETTIQFKPKEEWRPGMTTAKLVEELDRTVQVPGLSNIWVPPIRNRIDMLATGIKSPVGIKVSGPDLAAIDRVTQAIERAVKDVPGVTSALAERLEGGRYLDIVVDRAAAARFGLNIVELQETIGAAVGGENIGETVEGLARFPISVRYPREMRDSVEALRMLPIVTERGAQLPLSAVATVRIVDGPPMLKSENARLTGWVYVDVRGRDLVSVVRDAQAAVARDVKLPPGYSVSWSGQFEFLERAKARLAYVVPLTLTVIFVLLYLAFRRIDEALLIMLAVPFALVGGYWLLWALGYATSVATAVGFIALAGVAAEFGVVMLLYLRHAWEARLARGEPRDARHAARGDRGGRGAARAAEGDDGGRDHGGASADHAERRHRRGGDAADRGADGRRDDHRAALVDAGAAGGVPAAPQAPERLAQASGFRLALVEFRAPSRDLVRRQALDVAVIELPVRVVAPQKRGLHGRARARAVSSKRRASSSVNACDSGSRGLPAELPSGKSENTRRGTPTCSTMSFAHPMTTVAMPFSSSMRAARLTVW